MSYGNLDLKQNETLPVKAVGTYVYIISADAPVKIKGKGVSGILKSGQGIQALAQFSSIEIGNTVNALNSVDYVIGSGTFLNSELSGDVNATITQAETITENNLSAGVAAIELLPASATRKGFHVKNNSVNNIYLGGAGVTTNSALKLAPDEEWRESEASAAQWFVVADGAASRVDIIEVS